MSITPTPKVTREAYHRLREGPPYHQLINGEFVESSYQGRRHSLLLTLLLALLGPRARREDRGLLMFQPNLYLPGTENVYHPDLVYVSRGRLGICHEDGIYGAPDLVCEILSPTTVRLDRTVKLPDYARAGVPHVWLFDPVPPVTVEEYVLGPDGRYVLHAAVTGEEWEPAAFPGWRLSLPEVDAALQPETEGPEVSPAS